MNMQYTGNWSFSSLIKYEACALSFKLAKIDKLPELPRAEDNPLARGDRIHKRYEAYIKGESDQFDTEAKQSQKFLPILNRIRELYADGYATAEQNWWFNSDWDETGRVFECPHHGRNLIDDCQECSKVIWLWAKLDTSIYSPEQWLAITIDFKTGKSQYKAIEHIQQTQLYAAISAIKFPNARKHSAELFYLDEGHIRQAVYSQEEALKFVGRFDARAKRIYADRFFRANPNMHNCRYCPYGPRNGTGACPVGV